jgi:hypothetical protein
MEIRSTATGFAPSTADGTSVCTCAAAPTDQHTTASAATSVRSILAIIETFLS